MIHQFDPVIYPRKVWITYDATCDELNEFFPEGDGTDEYFRELPKHTDACVYHVRSKDTLGGLLIRFRGKKNMTSGIMSHEADHCANGIYAYIGAKVDVMNDETHAYLVEWIVNCCEIVKNKKNEQGTTVSKQ